MHIWNLGGSWALGQGRADGETEALGKKAQLGHHKPHLGGSGLSLAHGHCLRKGLCPAWPNPPAALSPTSQTASCFLIGKTGRCPDTQGLGSLMR